MGECEYMLPTPFLHIEQKILIIKQLKYSFSLICYQGQQDYNYIVIRIQKMSEISGIMPSEYQQQPKSIKVIIVGMFSVGKSSILIRYIHQKFTSTTTATVGADVLYKQVKYQSQPFSLQLWDTAGQQRYKSIVPNFFNLSKAAIIVFDISELKTFAQGQEWLAMLQNHLGKQIPMLILGNKTDLVNQHQLSKNISYVEKKINELKKTYNIAFYPVSAKTRQGIDIAFNYLIATLYDKYIKDASKKPKFEKIDLGKPKKQQIDKVQQRWWSKCTLI